MNFPEEIHILMELNHSDILMELNQSGVGVTLKTDWSSLKEWIKRCLIYT